MASAQASTLGDALIPVINRLQDIFSQVGGPKGFQGSQSSYDLSTSNTAQGPNSVPCVLSLPSRSSGMQQGGEMTT